ncbi:putative haloalkanoic acid dehalogenase [Aspergillus chevalieri]|uniref:Haloalkanoic acid dehalogenase n=2 Tax=Aspergillus subgen. Aspergillus TaxID=2720874 RepID=A0A7R7VUU9_ASPCH|nr:uncharacterized protein ACHE_60946S [Aspergillus chevalieri]BCR91060.1 hypothetical protein ACHE_60946S [Aspergillus chevalieri]
MAHFGTSSGVDKSTVIAAWKPRIPLAAMSLGSLHPDGEAQRLFKSLKGERVSYCEHYFVHKFCHYFDNKHSRHNIVVTMAQLSDYRVLSFDVYGTLVDWEGGILAAFQPTLNKNNAQFSREHLLTVYHELEREQQAKTPDMPYHELLASVHPQFTDRLGLAAPSQEESKQFGESVGSWPAFPDTVDALKRLSKHYKLVVLSNVDRESFAKTNAGSLEGFPFDLIITAQDVGSYKPALRNFEYMLQAVKSTFDIEASQVLQTAQSQFHDHHPASKIGIKSAWIERPGATMGNLPENIYDWRFDTLGDMADALKAER